MKNIKHKIGDLLESEKFSSATMTAMIIAVVLVANTVIFMVFSLLGWQISPAISEDFSISGNLDETLDQAGKAGQKITIMFCYPSEREVREHGTGGYVYRTAKEFEKKYPGVVEIKYVNIITNTDSDGNHVDVSEYATDREGNETPIRKSSVIFICGENYRVLTDLTTDAGYSNFYTLDYSGSDPVAIAYNGEEVMASAISWVLQDEHKTAYFTMGHGESIDPSFASLVSNAGYFVSTVDLKSADVDPKSVDLLIISNPKTDFEASDKNTNAKSESDRLEFYLESGGNLFVMLNSLAGELPVLESMLADNGISLSYSENADGDRAVNVVRDLDASIVPSGYTIAADFPDNPVGRTIADNVRRFSGGRVILGDVPALRLSGDAQPLLVSTSGAELFAHGAQTDNSGSYPLAAYSTVTGKDGTIGRIVVIPTAQMATTAALITNGYANKDFLYSIFECLYKVELLPYGSSIISFDTTILEGLTMGTANLYTALLLAIPAMIASAGAVILIRRKNR